MAALLLPVAQSLSCAIPRAGAYVRPSIPMFTDRIGVEYVWIVPGEFDMGNDEFSIPVNRVRITKGFWMARCLVTNSQYERFQKRSRYSGSTAADSPVVCVTKPDAQAFAAYCSKLSGHRYRLPTDAEWEYNARGGLIGKFYAWGDDLGDGRANIWSGNATPVKKFPPNGYGLYDMSGKAWSYVSDVDPAGPEKAAVKAKGILVDPTGAAKGWGWIARGGSYLSIDGFVFLQHLVPPDSVAKDCPECSVRLIVEDDADLAKLRSSKDRSRFLTVQTNPVSTGPTVTRISWRNGWPGSRRK